MYIFKRMGAKQSTNPRVRTYSSAGQSGAGVASNGAGVGGLAIGGPSSSSGGNLNGRGRTRSLGSVQNGPHGQPLVIPSTNGAGSPDSDNSTPEDGPFARGLIQASSLPVQLLSFHGEWFL